MATKTAKTQGEIEAAIGEGISRFEQDYMGRGPKQIHTDLINDFLVVRLQGVLTAAEQQLVKTLEHAKGRDLLKQVRTHLIETARPVLEKMVTEITGVRVLSLHHDISTATGEEVVLFTLAETPNLRQGIKRQFIADRIAPGPRYRDDAQRGTNAHDSQRRP
jgi:uncharacterized protein YbcI